MALHPDYGEHSYGLRLHSHLERKRSLSRDLLAPTVMSASETERLFERLDKTGISLDAIDCMEPLAFEGWVMLEPRKADFRVHPTPRTRDRAGLRFTSIRFVRF